MQSPKRLGPETPPAVPALAYLTAPGDRRAIAEACAGMGLVLAAVVREGDDGGRPELHRALDHVAAGGAGCLVVRRLEDLSQGSEGLAPVLERVDKDGIRLIALDVGLDTGRATGRLALVRHARPARPWRERPSRERREQDAQPSSDGAAEPRPELVAPASPTLVAVAAADGGAPATDPVTAATIGYTSTTDVSGPAAAETLAAQRRAIESHCGRGGFRVVEIIDDRTSADGTPGARPGLSRALQRIEAGEASCLVVCDLRRLSHSVAELGRLLGWLEDHDARLVALDLDLDTATDAGRTALRALASVGEWERKPTSEPPHDASNERRRAGSGRRAAELAAVHDRIVAMRADGMTLQAIADVLNEERVPTQRGDGMWRPSSVQSAAAYRPADPPNDPQDVHPAPVRKTRGS
ncbi:MAG: putative recombinase [Conexibacter sp.]|nr:putative recombinase [Conexibacter sp.]